MKRFKKVLLGAVVSAILLSNTMIVFAEDNSTSDNTTAPTIQSTVSGIIYYTTDTDDPPGWG